MNISQACDTVKQYAGTYDYALAMHIVSKETGFSTKELGAEFGRRRRGMKKKTNNKQMELGL